MSRLILVLLLFFLNSRNSNAQTIIRPYKYPINKGSTEWNNINNYQKLRSICQIPPNIVNQMTTEALFESVLDYPLLGDAFVFTTFQKGIENLKINFNAFETLNNRTDLGKVLINKYKILAEKKIDDESLISQGWHSVKFSFIELIFSQKFTNSTLTKGERMTVLKILVDNYYNKENEPGIYGTMSLSTCAWAINNVLTFNNADEKFLVKSKFVEDGNVFPQEILKEILSKAKLYLETVNQQ